MKPDTQSDRVLLQHIRECIERIREYTSGDRTTFFASRMVQDAVVRNLLGVRASLAPQAPGARQDAALRATLIDQ